MVCQDTFLAIEDVIKMTTPAVSNVMKKKLADHVKKRKEAEMISNYRQARLTEKVLWNSINSMRLKYVAEHIKPGESDTALKEMFYNDGDVKSTVVDMNSRKQIADNLKENVRSLMTPKKFNEMNEKIEIEASKEGCELPWSSE